MNSLAFAIPLGLVTLILAAACAATPDEPLVVREVRGETLVVEIPRSRVERILYAARDGGRVDRIFLEGRAEPLEGVVLEQTKEAVLVELGADWEAPEPGASRERIDGDDLETLKDELRQEFLRLGSLEGRMLESGAPLPECKVRVLRLAEATSLGIFSTWRPGEEHLAVTDRDGLCWFEELPEGSYKIFWWPPWEDGWVRRVPWEPDVRVVAGKRADFGAIETRRRTLR